MRNDPSVLAQSHNELLQQSEVLSEHNAKHVII